MSGQRQEPYPNKLRELRKKDGLSQAEIAKAWNMSPVDVSRKERGQVSITPEQLRILAQRFDWTPNEVLGYESSKEKVYNVDQELMIRAFDSIGTVASQNDTPLSEAEQLAYAVMLYNHVMKYISRGESAEPNNATAELILAQRH